MDAERAARQIVQAARRGEAERILSIPAALAAKVHGLAPGLTCDLFGLVARLLPSSDGAGGEPERGMQIEPRVRLPMFDRLTAFGRSAAQRFNQYPGPRTSPTSRASR
jgi:hypothetical protein